MLQRKYNCLLAKWVTATEWDTTRQKAIYGTRNFCRYAIYQGWANNWMWYQRGSGAVKLSEEHGNGDQHFDSVYQLLINTDGYVDLIKDGVRLATSYRKPDYPMRISFDGVNKGHVQYAQLLLGPKPSTSTTTSTLTTATKTTTTTHTIYSQMHRNIKESIAGSLSAELLANVTDMLESEIAAVDQKVDAKFEALKKGLAEEHEELGGDLDDLLKRVGRSEKEKDQEIADLKASNRGLQEQVAFLVEQVNAISNMHKDSSAGAAQPASACDGLAGMDAPQISAEGGDISLFACKGGVKIHSGDCSVDPCELKREIDELKGRREVAETP